MGAYDVNEEEWDVPELRNCPITKNGAFLSLRENIGGCKFGAGMFARGKNGAWFVRTFYSNSRMKLLERISDRLPKRAVLVTPDYLDMDARFGIAQDKLIYFWDKRPVRLWARPFDEGMDREASLDCDLVLSRDVFGMVLCEWWSPFLARAMMNDWIDELEPKLGSW